MGVPKRHPGSPVQCRGEPPEGAGRRVAGRGWGGGSSGPGEFGGEVTGGGRGEQGGGLRPPPQLWTSGCWGRPLRAGAGEAWGWWVGSPGALASLPVPETPVGEVGGSREAEGSKTSGTFCNR